MSHKEALVSATGGDLPLYDAALPLSGAAVRATAAHLRALRAALEAAGARWPATPLLRAQAAAQRHVALACAAALAQCAAAAERAVCPRQLEKHVDNLQSCS